MGLNLMQVTGRGPQEMEAKAALAATLSLDALYSADSFGYMEPEDIDAMVNAPRSRWGGSLGAHTHDDMPNAAGEHDASLGAGLYMAGCHGYAYGARSGKPEDRDPLVRIGRPRIVVRGDIDALLELAVSEFDDLQHQRGWGPSIFFHLSALYTVHPTYVQEMLTSDRYSHQCVIAAVKRPRNLDARSFCPRLLTDASPSNVLENQGAVDVTGHLKGCTVLILGSGD